MRTKLLLLLCFSAALLSAQAQVTIIKTFSRCSFEGAKLLSNGNIIFPASDSTNSQTLWVTDGTTSGTKRIGPDCPGEPFNLFYPYALGGGHIGIHCDGINYYGFIRTNCNELYELSFFKTDGDTIIYSDPSIYSRHHIDDSLAVGSKIYFFSRPKKIYSYDKNTNIITLEHDTIDPNPTVNIDVSFIARDGDNLLLSFVRSSSYGNRLVRFNTSTKTLTYIFDFQLYYSLKLQFALPNPTYTYDHGSHTGYTPPVFTWNNSYYFFIKYTTKNNGNYYSLWKTDGTSVGTVELKTFKISYQISTVKGVSFIPYNGKLYFRFSNYTQSGLWKTDGTPAGTTLVKALNVDTINHNYRNILTNLVELNGKLYFLASELDKDYELWESDGTTAGTKKTMEFIPHDFGLMRKSYEFPFIHKFNNRIYFLGEMFSPVKELISTDGTIEGTYSFGGNLYSGHATPIIKKNNELFFVTKTYGGSLYYLNKVDLDSAKPLFLNSDSTTAVAGQQLTVTGYDLRNAINIYFFQHSDAKPRILNNFIQVNDTTVSFTVPSLDFNNFKVAVATPQGSFISQNYFNHYAVSVEEREARYIQIHQTDDRVIVKLQTAKAHEYQLIDISGRVIEKKSIYNTITLHKNNYLPGVYILRVNNRSEKILIY